MHKAKIPYISGLRFVYFHINEIEKYVQLVQFKNCPVAHRTTESTGHRNDIYSTQTIKEHFRLTREQFDNVPSYGYVENCYDQKFAKIELRINAF